MTLPKPRARVELMEEATGVRMAALRVGAARAWVVLTERVEGQV